MIEFKHLSHVMNNVIAISFWVSEVAFLGLLKKLYVIIWLHVKFFER